MGNGWSQEYQDRREWRRAETRVCGAEESERRKGDRESSRERRFIRVRNERSDRAGVESASKRPRQVIDRCLERLAHAHLRQDYGRQYRPKSEPEVQ